MIEGTPLRDLCHGRWQSLLPALGVSANFLSGRHGPCPKCGGKDRFRFDDKGGGGSWICSSCGAGDGFALAMLVRGVDFKAIAEEIKPIVGDMPVKKTRVQRSTAQLREAMQGLWTSGVPVTAGDPVALYLGRRGISPDKFPPALRYVERCRYQDTEPRYFPAMVAKVLGHDGKPATLHRTYLTIDGHKAPVEAVRRLMPGPVGKGGAIRLRPSAASLGVSEGIETAMSAASIWGMPVWAVLNTSMMIAWEPPPSVTEVVIFADHDANYAGQAAAYSLANKLSLRDGAPRVRVEMPLDVGMDWNDALMAEREVEA